MLLTLLVAACSSTAAPLVGARSPASSPTAPTGTTAPSAPSSATPGTSPAPSPSASPDLPLQTADFSCRLPVMVATQYADGVTMTGGFVTFPAASYQADPRGVIQSRPTGDFVTTASPLLYGVPSTGTPFYDAAARRWLPAGAGQTSPDGSSYAYVVAGASSADPTSVHIVTVASGSDRVLSISPAAPAAAVGWEIGDYDGRAVYILSSQFEQRPLGVWRLDVASGSLSQLASVAGILMVRGGYAWVGLVDPADPAPPRLPRSGQMFDSIGRVDLATGAKTTWIYRPGQSIDLMGLDVAGHPVVSIASGPDFDPSRGFVQLITSPGAPGTPVADGTLRLTGLQSDLGRLWFGNDLGIYVWTSAAGVRKVYARAAASGTLAPAVLPAGFCV